MATCHEYYMSVKLLAEYDLEFISFTGGCTGSSKSIHVKMPHCWKSRHSLYVLQLYLSYSLTEEFNFASAKLNHLILYDYP